MRFMTFPVVYKKIIFFKKNFLFVCIVRTPSFAAIFGAFFARYIREITVGFIMAWSIKPNEQYITVFRSLRMKLQAQNAINYHLLLQDKMRKPKVDPCWWPTWHAARKLFRAYL